ncbi:glycosyltransferase [Thermodesulfobacteriota bacterium]
MRFFRIIKAEHGLIKRTLHYLKSHGIIATIKKILTKTSAGSHYKYISPELTAEIRKEIETFHDAPKISIILNNANPDTERLKSAEKSVKNQWEKCHELIIVENSEELLKKVSGDYVGFLNGDDKLTINALYEVARAIKKNRADIIYSDEDTIINNECVDPHFKPDFSPDLLLSYNYISNFVVVQKELLTTVGDFDVTNTYDLILRLTERAKNIHHIKSVLYHKRVMEPTIDTNNIDRKTLEATIKRRNIGAELLDANIPGHYRLKRNILDNPLVSIVIPFSDNPTLLKSCVSSILTKSTYQNFEIICISNNSSQNETFEMMEKLRESDSRITFTKLNIPFNYSKINNHAVNNFVKGEHIIFLNDDIEIISEGWIEAMLEHSQRENIGTVGAKLYYENDITQHAGIIVGLHGSTGHSHKYFESTDSGYFNRLNLIQNVSAVTGACLMIKRSLFNELSGFDEDKYKVAFNDVDLSLRAIKKGYRNIFTPYCEAYHHESRTRGHDDSKEKAARFNEEKCNFCEQYKDILKNGDPYYNPNLTLEKEDFSYKA